jgi:hypothetical protein
MTENPRVGGSIPSQATIFINSERNESCAFCFWDTFRDTFNFQAHFSKREDFAHRSDSFSFLNTLTETLCFVT